MDYLKGWDKNRLYQQNRCSCEHCCVSSNICGYCKDFSQPINWQTSNPPNLKCSQCSKTYHRKCLPLSKRKPNSWMTCKDIEEGCKCEKYLDFFTFLNEMPSNKETSKYESLIYEKFTEIYPNKKFKITSHFCGFLYNKWKYFIQDCTEILLNGSQSPGIARIIDIFTTSNKNSYLAIQWYWHANEFNKIKNKNKNNSNNELLFENNTNNLDIVAIETINNKVIVCDSEKEANIQQQKLTQLNRKKIEKINELKVKNKNKFNKLCLMQNILCYKSISFHKVFWSHMSCNGNINNMKIYKTIINDTNKKRMEMQHKILNKNIKISKNPNEKQIKTRKRKLSENEIIIMKNKKRKIENLNNNNNNNKNGIVSISYEEYNMLKKENKELKIEINRCKKYEEEILLLQKSNSNYKCHMDKYERNEKILKTEIIGLKQEINVLNKKWEKRDEILNEKEMKIKNEYKNKITELEFKIKKFEKTLISKNEQIEWHRKERDKKRGIQMNKNINQIPFHITSIDSPPIDPRKQDSMINQKDMDNNEMRRMF